MKMINSFKSVLSAILRRCLDAHGIWITLNQRSNNLVGLLDLFSKA